MSVGFAPIAINIPNSKLSDTQSKKNSSSVKAVDNVDENVANGLGKLSDYNSAQNEALKWLRGRGFKAEKVVLGKFGTSKGKPIGMSSADGKIGFRVEYDARNNAHINVWSGKEKGPHFKFDGSEKTVNNITKRFSR